MSSSSACGARETVCPQCLRVRGLVIARRWCWSCLVIDGRWVKVAWREVAHVG